MINFTFFSPSKHLTPHLEIQIVDSIQYKMCCNIFKPHVAVRLTHHSICIKVVGTFGHYRCLILRLTCHDSHMFQTRCNCKISSETLKMSPWQCLLFALLQKSHLQLNSACGHYMWFHFLCLYFDWGKFNGIKTGWALVQVCVIRLSRGLEDKMIPVVWHLHAWEWTLRTYSISNMPGLVPLSVF